MDSPPTGGRAALWTEPRRAILEHLIVKNSDAADLYRNAVDGLDEPLTRASLMIVGHCIRELVSALPPILGYPDVGRADASRAAKDLHQQWVAANLQLGFDGSADVENVTVPAGVFAAARVVANAGADGSKNSRTLTSLIVTGLMTEVGSAPVARVHKAIEFFRAFTHHRDYTRPGRPLPALATVVQELEIIEEALLNRLANMADRAQAVRGLLTSANRKVNEDES